ncbi:MAG: Dabb family protein [Candidatus Cloacimonetes bacterium]|nr:Dabb family protein [Candidatus Cloacimonadota bacterium]
MIRHIVFWKFKATADGCSALENRQRVADALAALPDRIPGIQFWELGFCPGACEEQVELCLNSRFASQQALDDYSMHPAHRAVVDLLSRVRSEKRVADYSLAGAHE